MTSTLAVRATVAHNSLPVSNRESTTSSGLSSRLAVTIVIRPTGVGSGPSSLRLRPEGDSVGVVEPNLGVDMVR
ncbi:unnamed protein product [Echinostoma caproni]|uniref:Uncharacterized protein n=1 Tax=Echinostoma caproni TaxID=27848 RepID=A0A183A3A2_9TREM|nr:unnamed protein product [Echinostoma caproni]